MKIITQGSLPGERVYRLTCNYCDTTFEFFQKEAKYNSDQRDGDFLSIDCPLCKRTCTSVVKGKE